MPRKLTPDMVWRRAARMPRFDGPSSQPYGLTVGIAWITARECSIDRTVLKAPTLDVWLEGGSEDECEKRCVLVHALTEAGRAYAAEIALHLAKAGHAIVWPHMAGHVLVWSQSGGPQVIDLGTEDLAPVGTGLAAAASSVVFHPSIVEG
jgi:hypothetical protein